MIQFYFLAALQSVFPQTELGTFMTLTKREKERQLTELTMIVTGIRLFNKECGKGGEGIDDCKFMMNLNFVKFFLTLATKHLFFRDPHAVGSYNTVLFFLLNIISLDLMLQAYFYYFINYFFNKKKKNLLLIMVHNTTILNCSKIICLFPPNTQWRKVCIFKHHTDVFQAFLATSG